MGHRNPGIDAGIALALLCGNLFLIAPYLRTDFSPQPWNNDYTYISMARMFRDQPWTWDPLQYGGRPFHYVYPPLFHVLLIGLPVKSLGRAYHLLSGFGYALVPVSLYWLALQLFRSRLIAAFAGIVYSVLPSPVYLVLPRWSGLASPFAHAPWPFVALIGYNEAAHTLSLAAMVLAVAAAYRGRWITAVLSSAAVFLLNWPGIVGLLMALTSVTIARGRSLGYMRAGAQSVAMAGIAYGLSAFWMTPGFFRATTLLNRVELRQEPPAGPWTAATWAILLAAAALLGLSLWRRTPAPAAFLLAWLALSGAVIVSFSVAGNALLPLPYRYVMEFNLGLVLALSGLVGAANRWRIVLAAAVLVFGAFAARGFLQRAWALQPSSTDPQQMPAFQIADWLARNAASSRVFAEGELEASLNVWTNVAQVGGSRQGILNFLILAAQREVAFGCQEPGTAAQIAELWLRALNLDYVVVHEASSREHFHWFVRPGMFDAFPVAWTNRAGDTIYRVPGPSQAEAVVVDLASLARLPRLRSTGDLEFLQAYVAWAQGKGKARIHWSRPDTVQVEADLGPGEGILVKSNYDIGWRVSTGKVEPDPIGFLLIRAPAGPRPLALKFGASWEVWLGRAITVSTAALVVSRAPALAAGLAAIIPALLAYGFLAAGAPGPIAVAEESFRRLQPPIINPAGIVDGVTNRQPPLGRGRVVTIYGSNFGSKDDQVRVWIDGRQARLLYRAANQLNVQFPPDVPPASTITVEVNGCRGNSFLIQTRD